MEEIDHKVKSIFARVFKLSYDEVQLSYSAKDVSLWDSVGHFNLISAVESELDILFEIEEIFEVVSVESLIEIISRKKSQNGQ